jgi:hypothetical protein
MMPLNQVQLEYAVFADTDEKVIVVEFNVPPTRMLMEPREARALAQFLLNGAAVVEELKK